MSNRTFFYSEKIAIVGVDWFLRIFPQGYDYGVLEQVRSEDRSISLHLGKSGRHVPINAVANFYLLDNENHAFSKTKIICTFPDNKGPMHDLIATNGIISSSPTDILLNRVFTLIPNGVLQIVCEFSWSYSIIENISSLPSSMIHLPLTNNYSKHFNVANLSDFRLEVGQKTFFVSKIILAQHSDVFATMFQSHYLESSKNWTKIENVNSDVFEAVLLSVYSGIVPDLQTSSIIDWLEIVDRYNFLLLRAKLESGLIARLNTENCVEIISLTNPFSQLEKLKKKAIKIIREHWKLKFSHTLKNGIDVTTADYQTICKELEWSPSKRSKFV